MTIAMSGILRFMKRGAFAAVQKDDKILFVKPPDWVSQYSGHWNFPGGVVEENESLEDGAAREVLEETNTVCSIHNLLLSDYNDKFDTSIAIFRAEWISGEVKVQSSEISDTAWFTAQEALRQPLAFDIKKAILALR